MQKPALKCPPCVVGLLAAATMLMPLCACSAGPVARTAMVAAPLATMALTGGFDGTGRLIAYLPDGSELEGRWALVTGRRPAAAVTIETPRGQINAADLASPDLPAFVGSIEGPPLDMICAFSGDEYSGYRCRCADNTGFEWVGAVRNRYGPNRGFNDNLVVSLRATARCPRCDEEVHDALGSR